MEKQLSLLPMNEPGETVCLVDPFRQVCQVEKMILQEWGFVVDTAFSREEGETLCLSRNYSFVITEFFPPLEKMSSFLRKVKEPNHKPYLMLSTSFIIDDQSHQRLFEAGLDDLLIKPYGRETLWAHLQKGLERRKKEAAAHPESLEVVAREYFPRVVRRELKKARRHQEPLSLILLRLPSLERLGKGFGTFYQELIGLLRHSLREEDLIGRENGNLGIILEKTDEKGSKILGQRLITQIQNHPAFQKDPNFQAALKELALRYYTFPQSEDVPAFIEDLLEEISSEKRFP